MKQKELTQEQLEVLSETGKLREFSHGRPESVREALQTDIVSLHTLYNYLIA